MIGRFLLSVCCAKHALADVKDVAQLGKSVSKAFVPTGQTPRLSGSVPIQPEIVEIVAGSRLPMHETPSSNKLGSTLHMRETLKEPDQELKEGYQHLRARIQKMPQADAKYAQHAFGFGSLMGLMASIGLVTSIGIAAVRNYFAHEEQALQSTVGSQMSQSPQRSRLIAGTRCSVDMAMRSFQHAALHRRSRQQLLDHLRRRVESPSGLLLFAGADNPMRHSSDHEPLFRQESTFHYLFGVREPGFSGAIDAASGRCWLFCPKLPAEYNLFMGAIASTDELRQIYDVDGVHYCEDFGSVLQDLAPSRLFIQKGKNSDSGAIVDSSPPMLQQIRDRFEVDEVVLHEAVLESRVHKHEYEVQLLREVNLISSTAHLRMMKSVLVGQWEYMLESNFRHECYHNGGCRLLSYTPIVGSGPNAAVLHYGHAGAPNDRCIQDGDMILCDLGAELHCYASDITNTFPANGKFNADQRLIFETVAAMQSAVMAAMRPGVDWATMQALAYDVLYERLCAAKLLQGDQQELRDANVGGVFMPHGLGHLMGIDTHDVGGYPPKAQRDSRAGFASLRMQRVLEPGMVLTVEPGCYFMPYALEKAKADPKQARLINWTSLERFKNIGGVRLEDNVLVVQDGIENLTVAPRTVDEVEAVISGAAPVEAKAFLDWRKSRAENGAKRARTA